MLHLSSEAAFMSLGSKLRYTQMDSGSTEACPKAQFTRYSVIARPDPSYTGEESTPTIVWKLRRARRVIMLQTEVEP